MAKKNRHKGKAASKYGPTPPPAKTHAQPKRSFAAAPNNEEIDLEAINNAAVASVSSMPMPAMVKQCRLCESKDGPFLNIFDGDKILAKRINQLLPLVIDEYDKLPHKICFRCSAKVEELHEFVQKCIRAQESLKRSLGESKAAIARKNWEEKLKENQMSNDDYCETLIKQAMEKIIGTSALDEAMPVKEPSPKPVTPPPIPKRMPKPAKLAEKIDEVPPVQKEETSTIDVKEAKILLDRVKPEKERVLPVRSTRTKPAVVEEQIQPSPPLEEVLPKNIQIKNFPVDMESSIEEKIENTNFLVGMVIKEKTPKLAKPSKKLRKLDPQIIDTPVEENKPLSVDKPRKEPAMDKINGSSEKVVQNPPVEVQAKEVEKEMPVEPEYDIMQHVCTIKVGGAGYLFQCKLCKRNFLKKEVVLGHHCARAGALRQEVARLNTPKLTPPKPAQPTPAAKELPKPGLVIRSVPKTSQSDKDIIEAFKIKTAQTLSINNFSMESPVTIRPKPGPASKKKVISGNSSPSGGQQMQQMYNIEPPIPLPTAGPSHPSVEVPNNFLGSNNRYKLFPGPNNTFTLIEDSVMVGETNILKRKHVEEPPKAPEPKPVAIQPRPPNKRNSKGNARNKTESVIRVNDPNVSRPPVSRMPHLVNQNYTSITTDNHNISNIASFPPMPTPPQHNQPYPVGLFQTIPCSNSPVNTTFTTAGMKKQSYSVVPTGNPSKLVISTKLQTTQPVPEPKAKKGKKTPEVPRQPYAVTLEDSAPPKEDGFFTFINVDPLLQPSYVLPTTSNIIQESQITTSTPAREQATANKRITDSEVYTCEICHLQFSREKKLLTHLQTHYSKQDEEEEDWNPSTRKKKSRKS